MNLRLLSILVLLVSGCTTVKRNGGEAIVKEVDYPVVDKIVTAYVGDELVRKGKVYKVSALVVNESMGGALYTIPASTYKQIGFDSKEEFYDASGVTRSGLADPVSALAVKKGQDIRVRVITVFGGSASYTGDFKRDTVFSEKEDSFQQTLMYGGRVGDRITIDYREFSGSYARPAFSNDAEYDLAESNVRGYKGALLEVIKADNNSITYKLLRNFP